MSMPRITRWQEWTIWDWTTVIATTVAMRPAAAIAMMEPAAMAVAAMAMAAMAVVILPHHHRRLPLPLLLARSPKCHSKLLICRRMSRM